MTLASDWVEEVRRKVLSGHREVLNRLSGAHDASTTTFTFEFSLTSIQQGAVLEVDLELVYVWSVDQSAKTATVQRGFAGSTAATHADDAVVTVNPKVSRFDALRELNNELASLSSPGNGLFRMRTVDLTYDASRSGYDLTSVADLIEVYDLRWKETGLEKEWPRVKSWEVARDMATAEFASTNAIFIADAITHGQTVRVFYMARYASLTALANDVATTTGLHTDAHDIPPVGAIERLWPYREMKRNFTEAQGDSKRAEEVPPGAVLQATRPAAGWRARRIAEEAKRLARMYPRRFR